MSGRAATAIRLVVGIGALAYLVSRVDLTLAWRTLLGADRVWILGALVAQAGSKTFWVRRWGVLLSSAGHPRPAGERFRLILLGLFFNNFLPSSIGGDVVRAWTLAQRGVPRATSAATVVAERLVGLLGLATMAVAGGVLGLAFWPGAGPWKAAAGFALALVAAITGLVRPEMLERVAGLGVIPAPIAGKVRRLLEAVAFLAGRGRTIATAFANTLGLSACSAMFHWSVGQAVGIPLPVTAFFVIVPAVMLFASLPITLNGIGLRELGFAGFLGAQGVAGPHVAVFAFLVFVLPLLFAVAGGVLFLAGGRRARPVGWDSL